MISGCDIKRTTRTLARTLIKFEFLPGHSAV